MCCISLPFKQVYNTVYYSTQDNGGTFLLGSTFSFSIFLTIIFASFNPLDGFASESLHYIFILAKLSFISNDKPIDLILDPSVTFSVLIYKIKPDSLLQSFEFL